ncbi:guanosine-diphosphatase [Coprinopsis marcescibilis]|uniref:guanosine-diphosphatase n=1 Tax=Coprinopsis marcescibilis TaxID=230819 RepID=A0A5C3L2X0_COPMA|nr:guanosine-diphosphatase [Coprinopsis marcescibilis]
MSLLSPRSGNYDRLEGGMGPSRIGTPAWRRFGWKKFAVIATLLITVVWLWGPRERNIDWASVKDYTKGLGTKGKDLIPFKAPAAQDEHFEPKEPVTHDNDEDPSKTVYCTKPHSPSVPLVQFALMIDAGSTGSRIHIYKFNNCKSSPTYEYEAFKMIQPGLSSFANDPRGAAKSLDSLLDEAVKIVPAELQGCTPVAVKATAGLRMLEGRKSEDILDAVRERITNRYKFQLPEKDGVLIMDGKDEGVYAWITANYLLGTINTAKQSKPNSYAVLDLGGASTQIVFQPQNPTRDIQLEGGEHKYDLAFNGQNYELYQHSYLGYGLMRARSHVHSLVDFMASIRPRPVKQSKYHGIDEDGDGKVDYHVVPNPCLAKHTERKIEIVDEDGEKRTVIMAGLDVGSFAACERIVQLVLAKDSICERKPCSFNGVYQPNLLESFKNGRVLLLSYFYDRVSPLLPPKSKTYANDLGLTVATIADYAKTVCEGRDTWKRVTHWAGNEELLKELEGRPEWCLDLTFMHGLLRLGYEFEDDRKVEFGKQIKGTELGWCLGATLALVGAGDIKCKA